MEDVITVITLCFRPQTAFLWYNKIKEFHILLVANYKLHEYSVTCKECGKNCAAYFTGKQFGL
jgi:hypothetical protein